ncbi:MAG TPA: phosphatase PAP2 family protein [Gaiellaceae bacterium]|nr:phosphatase PAP2 family protein [Gaiellaceae bacterium]
MRRLEALRRRLLSPARLEIDLLLVVSLLLTWQAVRIPLEGSVPVAMDNARSLLSVERALHLDVENGVMDAVQDVRGLLHFAYQHVHLPLLFGFLAVARLAAPAKYPLIRLTLFLSFVPSVLLIGLLPVAPPRWLPELGSAGPPADHELTATAAELVQNSTAAITSQHFGYAFLIAAGSLWLWPRSWLARATVVYPACVFVVILGTANHYVIDCVVGALTFCFGAAATALIAGGLPHPNLRPAPRKAVVGLAGAAVLLASYGVITAFAVALVIVAAVPVVRTVRGGRDPLEAADRA